MSQMTDNNLTTASTAKTQQDRLIELISPLVSPLGYEVVHVEVVTARQKTLRVFIDFSESRGASGGVGIQDCVDVTKALDEPLDKMPELERIFQGAYELEVSSPGVDRPLRTERDFDRFKGKDVRIHVYRPLTAEELENPPYREKNPKQKNFLGQLQGLDRGKVILAISAGPTGDGKKNKKGVAHLTLAPERVLIPMALISKANIEPKFDFLSEDKE